MEIGVLFADVRGFTSLAETLAPQARRGAPEPLLWRAPSGILGRSAVIDKLVGDEGHGAVHPPADGQAAGRMRWCAMARELLGSVGFGSGHEPWLRLGIGLDVGRGHTSGTSDRAR